MCLKQLWEADALYSLQQHIDVECIEQLLRLQLDSVAAPVLAVEQLPQHLCNAVLHDELLGRARQVVMMRVSLSDTHWVRDAFPLRMTLGIIRRLQVKGGYNHKHTNQMVCAAWFQHQ